MLERKKISSLMIFLRYIFAVVGFILGLSQERVLAADLMNCLDWPLSSKAQISLMSAVETWAKVGCRSPGEDGYFSLDASQETALQQYEMIHTSCGLSAVLTSSNDDYQRCTVSKGLQSPFVELFLPDGVQKEVSLPLVFARGLLILESLELTEAERILAQSTRFGDEFYEEFLKRSQSYFEKNLGKIPNSTTSSLSQSEELTDDRLLNSLEGCLEAAREGIEKQERVIFHILKVSILNDEFKENFLTNRRSKLALLNALHEDLLKSKVLFDQDAVIEDVLMNEFVERASRSEAIKTQMEELDQELLTLGSEARCGFSHAFDQNEIDEKEFENVTSDLDIIMQLSGFQNVENLAIIELQKNLFDERVSTFKRLFKATSAVAGK